MNFNGELLEPRRLRSAVLPLPVHAGIESGTDPALGATVQAYQDKQGRLIILGTNGDDDIRVHTGSFGFYLTDGSDHVDTSKIDGDHITAVFAELGGGNDTFVDDQFGPVTVFGGGGNDSIFTGAQDDVIYPGDGNDTVKAGGGNDVVAGVIDSPRDSDNDLYDLGAGNDRVADAYGNNTVVGGDGNDSIRTGDGTDFITGGVGRDNIRAGAGNDTVFGDGSRDTIYGQAGDDLLDGGGNGDTLVGGLGNDTLRGSTGDDLILAGNPNAVRVQSALNHIDAGTGSDRLQRESDNDDLTGVETLLLIVT